MFDELREFLNARGVLVELANAVERWGDDSENGRIVGRLREMEKELMKLAREFEDYQQ